ncbi:hypothetical protein, partial [uncultured Faecalibaculum sp.]|uniref:hypothetical protein n=1 Tax=uncultured Faecalibaculum sp. TaxID=1729681 RepID=UPI002711FC13
ASVPVPAFTTRRFSLPGFPDTASPSSLLRRCKVMIKGMKTCVNGEMKKFQGEGERDGFVFLRD